MGGAPTASIVINNHNYARFLRASIDSALGQTYPRTEVVVVDDGSTDESRDVIAEYGHQVVAVLKEHEGQDSAINAGFVASRGQLVVFLDSDDLLAPTAVEKALASWQDPAVAKVHWPLWAADQDGRPSGGLVPGVPLPEGDLLERVIRDGPHGYATSGMCGSAYARRFLERVFPVWEGELGAADTYLSMLAPLFGRVARLDEPQAYYRMHGQNTLRGRSAERLPLTMRRYEEHCTILARFLAARGIAADPAAWLACSWFHRLHRALQEIEAVVPPGAAFVLAELDQWEIPERWHGRRRIPFLERDGVYWGPPPDDVTAIRELERLRHAGAAFFVVGWPAFWWFDYYAGFHRYLRSNFPLVKANDRLLAFELTGARGGANRTAAHGSSRSRGVVERRRLRWPHDH